MCADIFSLTVFTHRSNTNSRIPGLIVAVMEGWLFAVKLDLSAYIPQLFFGALLTFICLDLTLDWLWHSRTKLSASEFSIVWATFLLTNSVGLEGGMALGCAIMLANFTLSYSTVPRTNFFRGRGSSVVRNHRLRMLLAARRSQIVTLQLRGFIFFGNVVSIVEDIERRILLPPTRAAQQDSSEEEREQEGGASGLLTPPSSPTVRLQTHWDA